MDANRGARTELRSNDDPLLSFLSELGLVMGSDSEEANAE